MDDIVNDESCHLGFYSLNMMLVLKTEGKKEFTILQTHTGSKTRSQFVTQPDEKKTLARIQSTGEGELGSYRQKFLLSKIAARK
jgi:hypothetical protein